MQFLVELIITYLLVGMCVQLPGVAWGHFLRLRWFRPVADAGWPIKVPPDYRVVLYRCLLANPIPFGSVEFVCN